jgi:type IV pilus assembly protein PilB
MSKSKNELNLSEAEKEGEACLRSILNHAIEENAESVNMRLTCEGEFTGDPTEKAAAGEGVFCYRLRTFGETSEEFQQKAEEFPRCVRLLSAISGGSSSFVLRDNTGSRIDCRWERARTASGEMVVIRLLYRQVASDLQSLAFDEETLKAIDRALAAPDGLIVIAGPTGSGKSTTMGDMIAAQHSVSRLNIEEAKTIVGQNIAKLLSVDADVLFGEIRDRPSAELAVEAANVGYQVVTTIIGMSAIDIPARLMMLGIERLAVAYSLRLLCSQRLVRLLCQECATTRYLTGEDIELLFDSSLNASAFASARECGAEIGAPIKKRHPEGCVKCKGRGYSGRKAVIEVLPVDCQVRRCISEGRDLGELMREMQTFKSLQEKGRQMLLRGETDIESLRMVIDFTR